MGVVNSVDTPLTPSALGDTAARIAEAKKMLECEARYWLHKPLAQRRAYLSMPGVQARRQALEAEMTRQHREKTKCLD